MCLVTTTEMNIVRLIGRISCVRPSCINCELDSTSSVGRAYLDVHTTRADFRVALRCCRKRSKRRRICEPLAYISLSMEQPHCLEILDVRSRSLVKQRSCQPLLGQWSARLAFPVEHSAIANLQYLPSRNLWSSKGSEHPDQVYFGS